MSVRRASIVRARAIPRDDISGWVWLPYTAHSQLTPWRLPDADARPRCRPARLGLRVRSTSESRCTRGAPRRSARRTPAAVSRTVFGPEADPHTRRRSLARWCAGADAPERRRHERDPVLLQLPARGACRRSRGALLRSRRQYRDRVSAKGVEREGGGARRDGHTGLRARAGHG